MILINIYNGRGLYGIGMVGMNLDGAQSSYSRDTVLLDSIIIVALCAIVQFAVWIVVVIIKAIYNNRKQKSAKNKI